MMDSESKATRIPKAMVFIDGPNIVTAAKSVNLQKINFQKLISELTKDTTLVGCKFYGGDQDTLNSFYAILEKDGIRVERVAPSKSVDGRLILQSIISGVRNEYDIAVLASGDRDFQPLIEELKKIDKVVWVASFNHTVAPALKMLANKFISLDKIKTKISL